MPDISERSFEEAIECGLLQHGPDACAGDSMTVRETTPPYGDAVPGGYLKRSPGDYDRALCLVPRDVADFILATQPKEWERLKQHHGAARADNPGPTRGTRPAPEHEGHADECESPAELPSTRRSWRSARGSGGGGRDVQPQPREERAEGLGERVHPHDPPSAAAARTVQDVPREHPLEQGRPRQPGGRGRRRRRAIERKSGPVGHHRAGLLAGADYGYVLEVGRVVMEDTCRRLLEKEDIKEFYLGIKESGGRGNRRWKKKKLWR